MICCPASTQARRPCGSRRRPTSRSGFRDAHPCGTYWGQLTANVEGDCKTKLPNFWGRPLYYDVCGYRPSQLRSAYGVPAGLTGKGVTVAVIDAYQSPTLLSDANHFAKDSGDPQFAPGQFVTLGPARAFNDQDACDASTAGTPEQAIDVEARARSRAWGHRIVRGRGQL